MQAKSAAVVALALLLCGCAAEETRVEYDPLEPLNRGVHQVNDLTDRVLLKPVAKGYKAIVPGFARNGVSNFFDNLATPRSSLNNFLQGKPARGFDDIARFLFNSTIGLGGLLDVASHGGLEEYDEDFGQTLAVWGVADGPYIVLPFLGPSTLRDAFVRPADIFLDPLFYYDETSVRDKVIVLQIIDLRTRLLKADRLLEDSKDKYITIRESYLQNRNYVIYDGDPPDDDDFYDDFEDFDDEELEPSDISDDAS